MGNILENSSPTYDPESSVAVPPLTPEQRAMALAKAVEVRRERAAIKARLKGSPEALRQVLAERDSNAAIAKMKVTTLVESLPGIGPARARRILDEVGIAHSRRLRGLGRHQVAALIARFEQS